MGYRAPEWSIRDDSLWALEILRQEGLIYDSSMAPLSIIGDPKYPKAPYKRELNNGSIWELPPFVNHTAMGNLPVGGGWGLRVFPYRMIRAEMKRFNDHGHPAVIYVHPREFDPDCPNIRLPWAKQFVLKARIERTEKRLIRLLDDFPFSSIGDYLNRLTNS